MTGAGRRRALLAVAGALFGALGCGWNESCGDEPDTVSIDVVTGTYENPSMQLAERTTGNPLFSGTFPHGRLSTDPPIGAGGVGGARGDEPAEEELDSAGAVTAPSTELIVDRAAGIVTRSYIDSEGRSVVERYRISSEDYWW